MFLRQQAYGGLSEVNPSSLIRAHLAVMGFAHAQPILRAIRPSGDRVNPTLSICHLDIEALSSRPGGLDVAKLPNENSLLVHHQRCAIGKSAQIAGLQEELSECIGIRRKPFRRFGHSRNFAAE
jgi:hypothetical protein